jgi:hypothetical protein
MMDTSDHSVSEMILKKRLLPFKINLERFFVFSKNIVFNLTNPNKTFTLKE